MVGARSRVAGAAAAGAVAAALARALTLSISCCVSNGLSMKSSAPELAPRNLDRAPIAVELPRILPHRRIAATADVRDDCGHGPLEPLVVRRPAIEQLRHGPGAAGERADRLLVQQPGLTRHREAGLQAEEGESGRPIAVVLPLGIGMSRPFASTADK